MTRRIVVGSPSGCASSFRISADTAGRPDRIQATTRTQRGRPTYIIFVGLDKHWPLFESLEFSADAYLAAFERALPGYDLRNDVAQLDVPTLLIVGAQDPYLAHMEWLAASLPRAELSVLDRVGHWPFVEEADLF